jgi:hypothetical protein
LAPGVSCCWWADDSRVVQGVLVGRVVARVGEERLIPAAIMTVAFLVSFVGLRRQSS